MSKIKNLNKQSDILEKEDGLEQISKVAKEAAEQIENNEEAILSDNNRNSQSKQSGATATTLSRFPKNLKVFGYVREFGNGTKIKKTVVESKTRIISMIEEDEEYEEDDEDEEQ